MIAAVVIFLVFSPITAYFSCKLGRVGFLRANQYWEESKHKKSNTQSHV